MVAWAEQIDQTRWSASLGIQTPNVREGVLFPFHFMKRCAPERNRSAKAWRYTI